jgi:hypothetical protein
MAIAFLTDKCFEEFKDFFEDRPYRKETITSEISAFIFDHNVFGKSENVLLRKDYVADKTYATTKVQIKRHDKMT